MERMIRKQVYIEPRHEAILKRVAREKGVTEAQVVREAIELEGQRASAPLPPDPRAWEEAKAFMLGLSSQGAIEGGRSWKREDLYDR
jgi:hypothetical protein